MTPRIENIIENNIEKKRCCKCKIYKDLTLFGNSKTSWDKLRPNCKDCLRNYNIINKNKISNYNKKYWQETKEIQKEKSKKWREENSEYVKFKNKEWLAKNKEYKKQKDKEYRIKNWDIKKEYNKIYKKKQYIEMKNNPNLKEKYAQHKIKYNISRRIREILCQQKSESSLKYTGCSLEKLKIHLESTMEDGMHWKNYGTICVFSLQKFKSILVA